LGEREGGKATRGGALSRRIAVKIAVQIV